MDGKDITFTLPILFFMMKPQFYFGHKDGKLTLFVVLQLSQVRGLKKEASFERNISKVSQNVTPDGTQK